MEWIGVFIIWAAVIAGIVTALMQVGNLKNRVAELKTKVEVLQKQVDMLTPMSQPRTPHTTTEN